MEVKATAQGYYENRIRNEGEVFRIKNEFEFSDVWMERLDDDGKPVKSKKKANKVDGGSVNDQGQFQHDLDDAVDGKGSVI